MKIYYLFPTNPLLLLNNLSLIQTVYLKVVIVLVEPDRANNLHIPLLRGLKVSLKSLFYCMFEGDVSVLSISKADTPAWAPELV